jgi:hypothetical protein
VSKVFVIPGNLFSNPVPSVAKFPKAPRDTNPWGWYPVVSTLLVTENNTKDICSLGI